MNQPYIFTVHSRMGELQRVDTYYGASYEVNAQGVLSIYEKVETADGFLMGECVAKFSLGIWTRVEQEPNQ